MQSINYDYINKIIISNRCFTLKIEKYDKESFYYDHVVTICK